MYLTSDGVMPLENKLIKKKNNFLNLNIKYAIFFMLVNK